MAESGLMLRNAAVDGGAPLDLLVRDGRIAATGVGLRGDAGEVIDVAGAAVLPGLHDHHCHLLAMQAVRESVPCGPPEVSTVDDLAAALRGAPAAGGWLRGIGYHESVAGDLDRGTLDRVRADVPVRVQHRGGSLWVLNSAGIDALGLQQRVAGEPAGIERDVDGAATGRLWRCDDWLRARLGPRPRPELGPVSAQLASYGVTGVTDATPDLDTAAVEVLRSSGLRQRLVLLGDAASPAPRKIVVSDHALPTWDELVASIAATRPRAVAVHCVTRVALALALAVLGEVGTVDGDRIEHAAVAPPTLVAAMAELGVTVVTQPSLPALRGDRYLADVDADDRDHLWPYASLLAAGVPVGCSSDAPYGSPDPWFAIAAASARRTGSGRALAPAERVAAGTALRGYLTDPRDPGGAPRRVQVGAAADLVVLDAPLATVLAAPDAVHVRLTLIGGEVVHRG